MGFRFRRRIKIFPGVHLNVGKKGFTSLSIGRRGAQLTFNKEGMRSTVGIPGTGLSYTTTTKYKRAEGDAAPVPADAGEKGEPLPYLKQCPYCGHRCRKRWDNCPECGQALDQPLPEGTMKCAGCGAILAENLNYCPLCGQEFHRYPGGFCEGLEGELTEADKKYLTERHLTQCQACHAIIPDAKIVKFCTYCGKNLHELTPSERFWSAMAVVVILILIFLMLL